jgi:hypothetical protein
VKGWAHDGFAGGAGNGARSPVTKDKPSACSVSLPPCCWPPANSRGFVLLGNVKGAVLREFVLFCQQHDDRQRLTRALRALDEAYPGSVEPERLGGGFLASRWYPAELVHVLVDEMIAGRSDAEQKKLAQRAANVIMSHTLRGVYRFLFSTFATPDLYARHANKLWSLHYDNGLVEVDNKPREGLHRVAHTRVLRWISHHPFVCMMNGAATIPIYEAMGCRNVRCEVIACVSDGSPNCAWIVHWSDDDVA